jgi:hypothetical protein
VLAEHRLQRREAVRSPAGGLIQGDFLSGLHTPYDDAQGGFVTGIMRPM